MEGSIECELLVSIDCATPIVRLTTTARQYALDIGRADEREVRRAKVVLREMNFDRCFEMKGV
jgi:hypothetical protein